MLGYALLLRNLLHTKALRNHHGGSWTFRLAANDNKFDADVQRAILPVGQANRPARPVAIGAAQAEASRQFSGRDSFSKMGKHPFCIHDKLCRFLPNEVTNE
jgi:hypothetical protein